MRAKSILLLLIALGCGVVASVAVSQVVLDQKNRGEVKTVGILVVAKDLSASTKIPPESFRVEQWPLDRVPIGAVTDPKMVENKFTKQRLYAGEPIIEAKLSAKGKEFSVPVGYRIFDIVVRDESGGGGYIGPGDHVDVFGYFDKSARVHAAKSVKVMENLEVVMIDGVAVVDPEATTQKKSNTIQLLVKDSQYVVLDTAANLGKLRLALRPPEQASTAGGKYDEGESFMSWLKESEPASVEKPTTSEQKPIPSKPERIASNEMLVITANKSTVFREINGKWGPISAEVEAEANKQPQALPYFPPYKSPTKEGSNGQTATPSHNAKPSQFTKSADPSGAASSNMSGDPTGGSWQPGGFKATYPSTK
ncbi:MAG: Flp pilus assembly protein CpaB [Pirellula sp.]